MISSIKDPFSYAYGHGAAGLSCSDCEFYAFDKTTNTRQCDKHNINLKLAYGDGGRISGEAFCSSFTSESARNIAHKEFISIKEILNPDTLYKANGDEFLEEYKIK